MRNLLLLLLEVLLLAAGCAGIWLTLGLGWALVVAAVAGIAAVEAKA